MGYTRYPAVSGGGGGINKYADYAALPGSAADGDVAITIDTDTLYVYDGASWVAIASPSSVITGVGTLDSGTPSANGAHIDSGALIMQSASATEPGLVNTAAQSFAGDKTFEDDVAVDGSLDAGSVVTPDVDVAATGGTDTLNIGGTNADVINIGRSGATVNIQGSTLYENVTQLQVSDPLITLNKGGGAGSAAGSGIELEEASSITGYAKTSGDRNSWLLKAPNTAGDVTITPGASGITLDQSSHNPVTLGTANGLSLSTQQLSLALSSGSTTGALSDTDWVTFNSKQAAGNYITALTGDVTASGPGSVAATIAAGAVDNGKVAAGAGIALNKLAAATASRAAAFDASGFLVASATTATELGYVSGVTSAIQTQLNAKQTTTLADGNILVGNVSNVAAAVAMSGDVTISNAGVTAIGALKVTNGMLAGSIAASKLIGSDIATVGTITSGVWNGTKVSEAYGGTNQNAYTTGDMLYASATNTLSKLAKGSANQVLGVTGADAVPSFRSIAEAIFPNYIAVNPNAAVDTTGWATYADSAANIPADGTGGTATNLTFSRSTSSPLRGAGQFSMVQANSTSLQGKGVSYDFTIDAADKAQVLSIQFDYNASSTFVASNGITAPLNDGTTSTNAGNSDIEVFIYDVTNAVLIPVNPQVITANGSNNFSFKGEFQTASNSTSYRLIFHIATASANATGWTFLFDNVYVGRQPALYGPPVTDPVAWTPTGTWSTNTTYTGFKWRVGSLGYYYVKVSTSGAPDGVNLGVNMPGGEVIDTARMTGSTASVTMLSGGGEARDASPAATYKVNVAYLSTTSVTPMVEDMPASYVACTQRVNSTAPMTFAASDYVELFWAVPIVGWSSSTTMSNATDTRVVALQVSGCSTSVTSAGVTLTPTTVVKDTHGGFSSTTYAIPVSGFYQIQATLTGGSVSQTAGQTLWVGYSLDGGSDVILGLQRMSATATIAQYPSGAGIVYCTAGQVVRFRAAADVTQTAGGLQASIFRLSGPAAIAASESVNMSYSGSTTAQTGSVATLVFPTKLFDSHNCYNTSTGVYTVPVSGKYQVSGYSKTGNTSGTGVMLLQAVQAGSASVTRELGLSSKTSSTSAPKACSGVAFFTCVAGDTLVLQGSDADSNAVVAASHIEICRIGN